MTREELFDILRHIVLSVTGVPECILADEPGAPAPTGFYASIEPMVTVNRRGQANQTVGTDSFTLKTGMIAEASVQFYRGDARSAAQKLAQCHKLPSVNIELLKAGVGWQYAGPVNDLTTIQSNRREQRAQVSIYVMYEEVLTETFNTIESAEIAVQYPDGTVIDTIEVSS